MHIQCKCGQFKGKLKSFPQDTPGRLMCYCDDCQSYLHHIGRSDLLDENAGTEVIPVYPDDLEILCGKDKLKCLRLSPRGMFRFFTSCCNTPVGNTRSNFPWIGLFREVYIQADPDMLDKIFPTIRSRIMGRYAKGTPPKGTPKTFFSLKGFTSVVPFILKGKFKAKYKHSPLFLPDGKAPIVAPHVLSLEERQAALHREGF